MRIASLFGIGNSKHADAVRQILDIDLAVVVGKG
jgi:hypothetical protein